MPREVSASGGTPPSRFVALRKIEKGELLFIGKDVGITPAVGCEHVWGERYGDIQDGRPPEVVLRCVKCGASPGAPR